jgi:D-glycero-beta-D-manno-heptose-7-phosphate kinase
MNKQTIVQALPQMNVLVIGDVMVDTYWWGNASRISPEAPVPIIDFIKEEKRLGGSGNVALNLAALGVNTHLLSVVGADDNGNHLQQLCSQQGINSYFIKDKSRPTTQKTRIIAKSQQTLRVDTETTQDISAEIETQVLEKYALLINQQPIQAIILEDYNKGLLTQHVISQIIEIARSKNIIVTVDPKRKNFFAYQQATIFKPNAKEIKEAFNLLALDYSLAGLQNLHTALHEKLNHQYSCITLSEKGIFYSNGKHSNILPTYAHSIADVSGAGDTVIAVLSVVFAITQNIEYACHLANLAAAQVCSQVGTVALQKDQWLQSF